jgi:hypothetical protein
VDLDALREGRANAIEEIGNYGYDVRASYPLRDGSLVAMFYDFTEDEPRILHVGRDEVELDRWDVPPHDAGFVTESVVVDPAGLVWTALGTKFFRLDMSNSLWDELVPGGNDLRLFPRSLAGSGGARPATGTWTQLVDPGTWSVAWKELSWEHLAGKGNRVAVAVRFADSVEGLEASTTRCGPFAVSPVDISECSEGRRYARVEIQLAGTGQPVAGNVRLTWDRP